MDFMYLIKIILALLLLAGCVAAASYILDLTSLPDKPKIAILLIAVVILVIVFLRVMGFAVF